MKKVLFILMIGLFAVTSCKNSGDKKFQKKVFFENQNWKRFDNQEFVIPVTPKDTLDFDLKFIYSEKKLNYKVYPINVTFYTPNEEIRSRDIVMRLYNYKTKQWKGEKDGDTISYNVMLYNGMTFRNAGNLKVVIENKNPRTENPGVVGIELVVDKSKKK